VSSVDAVHPSEIEVAVFPVTARFPGVVGAPGSVMPSGVLMSACTSAALSARS
jgi:hypothetical protein